jgi:hypothetical protein
MNSNFAIPQSVVKRTIQLIKQWKKLLSSYLFVRQSDLFLIHLIMIACYYTNHLI